MKKNFFVLILFVAGALASLPVSVQACILSVTLTSDGAELSSVTLQDIGEQIVVSKASGQGAPEDLDWWFNVTALGDPEVSIEFGVRNTTAATKTYKLGLEILGVDPAMINPTAAATASFTLTDRALSDAGATMAGLFGGQIYQARYNGSSVFTNLVDSFSFTRTGSNLSDVREASTGDSSIAGAVTSIESEVWFTLSSQDSASGTTDFVITPEPMSLSLLAIGGIALLRRSRR